MAIEANVTKNVSYRINAKFTDEETGDTIKAVSNKASVRLTVKKSNAYYEDSVTIPNTLFESLSELLEAIRAGRDKAANE